MDDPGNLFAEFFNACPFIHYHLEGRTQILDRSDRDLGIPCLTLAQLLQRPGQLLGHLPIKSLCFLQQIHRRTVPTRKGHIHMSGTRLSCLFRTSEMKKAPPGFPGAPAHLS